MSSEPFPEEHLVFDGAALVALLIIALGLLGAVLLVVLPALVVL